MEAAILFGRYWHWHFGQALKDMFGVWMNFLWFFYHFFSVPTVFSTLLSPWKRLDEPYKKGLDLGAIFSTLIVNILMRLVGFAMRAILLLLWFVLSAFTFLFGAFVFILWFTLPLSAIFSFAFGGYLLFS